MHKKDQKLLSIVQSIARYEKKQMVLEPQDCENSIQMVLDPQDCENNAFMYRNCVKFITQ